MAHRVCPWWLGYWLLIPFRRLREHPVRIVGPHVREGMLVLEPGCGMGYFTLDVARMVGPSGRVVAVDVQERMLAGLRRRARRAGVLDRIDARLAKPDTLGVADLEGRVDVALALHMVHEVPDAKRFFTEIGSALKPGGKVIFIEPRGHVSVGAFAESLGLAAAAGLRVIDRPEGDMARSAILSRASISAPGAAAAPA